MKRFTLACLVALAPAVGWANIIPTGSAVTGTGPFLWTYNFQLSSDQDVHSGAPPAVNPVPQDNANAGSFLTLYDFAGYIPGSCAGPLGWTCTAQLLGYTPSDVSPIDDPMIPNLTWTYTSGATLSGAPDGLDLGIFSAETTSDTSGVVSYAARAVKNNGDTAGSIADNVGTTRGPVALQSVPEPASIVLATAALGLLGWTSRRKARI
jgi:hypothetical protein